MFFYHHINMNKSPVYGEKANIKVIIQKSS